MADTLNLYTTPERVFQLLRLQSTPSTTTQPTKSWTNGLIENKMTEIDNDLDTSFRLSQMYEYLSFTSDYLRYTGLRIPLSKRSIITPLSTAAGDSLQVFDGTNWTEWVGVNTESRSGDFWFDEVDGILNVINKTLVTDFKAFKIRYRYNEGVQTAMNDPGGITSGDTTVIVTSTANMPYQGWFRLESEEIRYNAKTATTLTLTERGAFGTTAASHADTLTVFWVPSDIVDMCTMMVAIDLLNAEDWSSGGGTGSPDIPGAQLNVSSKISEWKEKIELIKKKWRARAASAR